MRTRRAHPLRTCLGCRRVRPQAELLRLARRPDGRIEPDPGGRAGGRGAYLCPRMTCVTEAVRRGRWPQAFRAPAVLPPEAMSRLRELASRGQTPPEALQGGR